MRLPFEHRLLPNAVATAFSGATPFASLHPVTWVHHLRRHGPTYNGGKGIELQLVARHGRLSLERSARQQF